MRYLIIIIFANSLFGQTIFTPINSEVYSFLDNISTKNLLSIDSEVLPFTRKYISSLLISIKDKEKFLSIIEQQELNDYLTEYSDELGKSNGIITNFKFEKDNFRLKIKPYAGYGLSYNLKESGFNRHVGIGFAAEYSNYFSAYFDFTDRGEFGNNTDDEKLLSPVTGATFRNVSNGFEFSDVLGGVSYNWNWGSVSLIRDYFKFGEGYYGSLMYGTKSPAFPQIYLILKPTESIRFYYFHGWLTSNVVDSSRSYYGNPNSDLMPLLRERYINKYIVANLFAFDINSKLTISLGNSFVYSGDLRAEMFIPFLFYKILDHNLGKDDIEDGNGQLFMNLRTFYIPNTKLYFSFFLDVAEIRSLLNNDTKNTWFAYTIGSKTTDVFFDNLNFIFEYTRVNPWVYEHKDITTTYKHMDYVIGFWGGQNSDLLRLELSYKIIKGFASKLFFERSRKGSIKDVYYAYRDDETEPFLYGNIRRDYKFGLRLNYEFYYETFVDFEYYYSDIYDTEMNRTPEFLLGKGNNFSFNIYIGLRGLYKPY